MKKILFFAAALAATCSLGVRADEYHDFGTKEDGMAAWKGDFAVGDIDGDGDLDILFAGEENAWIMLNDGQGNFTKQTEACPFVKGLIGDIALGDIDGDGDLDVIYATWSGTAEKRGIALNDGNGVFTAASREQYPIIESYEVLTREGEEGMTTVNIDKFTSCGFADFNLDGLLDYYFFANYTVGRRDKLDENGQPVLDENNNPVKEEIPGSFRNNKVIYFQNADGTFTPDENFFAGTTEYRINEPEVTVIDFDRDGTPDIWMNGGNEANECDNGNQTGDSQRFSRLFKNDDGLNFFEYNLGENGVSFEKSNGTCSWADIDGDGYLDLLHHGDGYLCSGETNDRPNRVYRNLNGTGLEERFMVEVARDGYFGNGTTWVDWNGDGTLDFISGGWDAPNNIQATKLYLGDAENPFSFTQATGSDYAFWGVSEQSYRVADLNGDGRPDLLECGHGAKVGDEGGRRMTGWVSNSVATPVSDMEAPVLNNVAIDNGEEVMITFSWSAPASLAGKRGLTWNLALKNVTTGKWLYNPMSNPETGECFGGRLGNVSTATTYNLYNLPAGTYEWTVQAIDASGFSGAFAAKQTFTVGASGVESVSGYNPAVFVNDNTLSIVGMQGEAQTVNVYSISGARLNTAAFNDNIELQLPQTGIYLVEVLAADGGQYITKVVVK